LDSSQNQCIRRKTRNGYRELIVETNELKQEYIRPESDGLHKALQRGDELYQEVKMPREAALDSEFLTLTSQLGLERTRRLHTAFKSYDINDFISRVRAQLLGVNPQEDVGLTQDIEPDTFDWIALGPKASTPFQSTKPIEFMLGPLNVKPVAKKVRKQTVKEKKSSSDKT